MKKKFILEELGYEVEIGKFANQADGAVWFKKGGTIVLATAVSASLEEFPGFLPLTVDYREMFSAGGKIPGGYFKREGKSSDKEVLTGRLIDRAIRPLFPEQYFNQVQVLATAYSVDKINTPGHLALLASSLALSISKIPFMEPVGIVEVCRVNGDLILEPTYPQALDSELRIVVAGTEEGICMVEGSASELPEDEFIDILFKAHERIKIQVQWQKKIQKEIGVEKEPIKLSFDWNSWMNKADAFLTESKVKDIFIFDKIERGDKYHQLKESFLSEVKEEVEKLKISLEAISYIFEIAIKEKITALIFKLNKRVDTRAFDQVRDISVEVGLLPFTHGSACFNRGRTQALVSTTLGGGQDEQRIEDVMGEVEDGSFMLHYNFPPFCTGEVKPMRGPSRRDVGHGHLAASAIRNILPDKEEFPYTIRVVSDILECDGSSSMATVCGSTMSLMDAGVPIKKMVAGVAMGLLPGPDKTFTVITDIAGVEDAYGLMDFKVAGTDKGIMAIQMDIKYKGGLARSVFESALVQAKKGRLFILSQMQKVMDKPRAKMSDLVPKIVTFKVDQDKIGAIVGPGGKVIREIIAKTGTMIDIDNDGTVKVLGPLGANIPGAVNWVKVLSGQLEIGAVYEGKVRRIAEFGLFVELVPGKDGLLHISNIPKANQVNLEKYYKIDDVIKVIVVDYDTESGKIRLKLANK